MATERWPLSGGLAQWEQLDSSVERGQGLRQPAYVAVAKWKSRALSSAWAFPRRAKTATTSAPMSRIVTAELFSLRAN